MCACVGRRVNERDSRKVSTFRSGNGFGSPCHCDRATRSLAWHSSGCRRWKQAALASISRKKLPRPTLFAARVAGLFSVLIKVIASGRAQFAFHLGFTSVIAGYFQPPAQLDRYACLSFSFFFFLFSFFFFPLFESVTSESGNFVAILYYRDILARKAGPRRGNFNRETGDWFETKPVTHPFPVGGNSCEFLTNVITISYVSLDRGGEKFTEGNVRNL